MLMDLAGFHGNLYSNHDFCKLSGLFKFIYTCRFVLSRYQELSVVSEWNTKMDKRSLPRFKRTVCLPWHTAMSANDGKEDVMPSWTRVYHQSDTFGTVFFVTRPNVLIDFRVTFRNWNFRKSEWSSTLL